MTGTLIPILTSPGCASPLNARLEHTPADHMPPKTEDSQATQTHLPTAEALIVSGKPVLPLRFSNSKDQEVHPNASLLLVMCPIYQQIP